MVAVVPSSTHPIDVLSRAVPAVSRLRVLIIGGSIEIGNLQRNTHKLAGMKTSIIRRSSV